MEIVLNPFIGTIFNLFLISALVITMYTLNFYYLVLLSSRRIANMDVVAFKADLRKRLKMEDCNTISIRHL